MFQAGLRVEKKGRTKYEDPWRWGHEVLYWDKAVRKGVWELFACRPLRLASIDRAFPLESVVGGSLKETRSGRRVQVSAKEKTSSLKKIIRFLFIGFWESIYRRKQQRELYNYHAFSPPLRRDQLVYFPRYRWIRKGKDSARNNQEDKARPNAAGREA